MHGLVAYDDDSEDEQAKAVARKSNDVSLKTSANNAEARKSLKSQVIIKRPPRKSHTTRAHVSEDIVEQVEPSQVASTSTSMESPRLQPYKDELAQIRQLLRPPPIDGLEEWGIPPPSTEPCNPALEAKLSQFQALKTDPSNPRHFNDSLMSNRAFRNPHLYAKLVEFVDADERATNFPKDIWNPDDLSPEWYADKIAEVQKARYEQQQSVGANPKRTQIDFMSARPKEKDPQQPHKSNTVRHNPYGSHHYSKGGLKDRQKGRWG